MWRTDRIALAALILWVCVPTASFPTAIAPKMSLETMAEEANVIAIGTCRSLESQWIDRNLVTRATVEVEETLAGKPHHSLTVLLPGGVDDRGPVPLASEIQGGPSLMLGERAFLFLREIPQMPDHYVILGFSQGKFAIRERPGDEARIVRDLSDLVLQGGDGMERGHPTSDSLEAFRRRVRRILDRGGAD